jgi:hypothetical protein
MSCGDKIFRTRWLFSALCLAGAFCGCVSSKTPRDVQIAGWKLTVPPGTETEINKGPDFSVTYMYLAQRRGAIGVYEGGHPISFAPTQTELTKQADMVAGRNIEWAQWVKREPDSLSFYAQTYLEDLHIFLAAPSEENLEIVKEIIRSLRK